MPAVLIVDPIEKNLAVCKTYLESLDIDLVLEQNPKVIVSQAKVLLPALIIMATKLGDPDGYQLLNQLRSQPETKHIPIILLPTNLSETQMQLHGDLINHVHVLPKPVNGKRLLGMVRFFLKQHRYKVSISSISGEKNRTLIESSDEGVLAVDEEGSICFANAAAETLLKAKVTDLVGQYIQSVFEEETDLIQPDWQGHPIAKVTRTEQILQVESSSMWRTDGECIKVKFAAIPIQKIAGVKLLLAFRQIKETREGKKKLIGLSNTDHLTGLPTRAKTEEFVEQIVELAKARNFYFGLLYIDLDHFTYINESLGHDRGDALIKVISERIKLQVRRDDIVGRMEGDEFMVILTQLDHPTNAGSVAKKIIQQLHEPFLVDGHEIYTSCSIGVSVYPNCGDNTAILIKNAELATIRAKDLGRNNYQFFTAEMNRQRAAVLELEYDLHKAFELHQFDIQYLPHIDTETGELAAIEARLVWNHPENGVIESSSFLDIAEDAGLGLELFNWLWKSACKQLGELKRECETAGNLMVVMPMSLAMMANDHLEKWLLDQVGETGLSPQEILIAVAESSLMARNLEAMDLLRALNKQGFQFCLDNFGTGYGSLDLIRSLPYSFIKLSESFVDRMGISRTDATIVDSSIYLAHNLGINVMATGITKKEQWEFLVNKGCDWLQGDWVEQNHLLESFAAIRTVLEKHPSKKPAS